MIPGLRAPMADSIGPSAPNERINRQDAKSAKR